MTFMMTWKRQVLPEKFENEFACPTSLKCVALRMVLIVNHVSVSRRGRLPPDPCATCTHTYTPAEKREFFIANHRQGNHNWELPPRRSNNLLRLIISTTTILVNPSDCNGFVPSSIVLESSRLVEGRYAGPRFFFHDELAQSRWRGRCSSRDSAPVVPSAQLLEGSTPSLEACSLLTHAILKHFTMAAIACTSGRVTISCKSPKNYSPASNARASPSMAARAMSARVALPTKLSRSTVSTRAVSGHSLKSFSCGF